MVDCSLVNHKVLRSFSRCLNHPQQPEPYTVYRINFMAMILWRRSMYNINASLLMNTKYMPRLYNPRRLLNDYPIRYNIPHVLKQSYKPDVLRTTPVWLTANRYGLFADIRMFAGLRIVNRCSIHPEVSMYL